MTSMTAWLEALVAAKGSDLHLEVGSPPRTRVDGQRLVRRAGDLTAIMAESGYYGMQTFDQHLIALHRDGVIALEDALSVATNPHDLQVALRNQGLVA